MSFIVTETSTFTSNVISPSNSEAADSTSVLAFISPLANRTRYLKDQLTGGAPGTVTCLLPLNYSADLVASGSALIPTWATTFPAFIPRVTQQSVSGVGACWFDLSLPHGTILHSLAVNVTGKTGHAALPGTMPQYTLQRIDLAGAATVLSAPVDGSANVSAYQAAHDIGGGTINIAINDQNRYALSVFGEQGSNSTTGLTINNIKVVYS